LEPSCRQANQQFLDQRPSESRSRQGPQIVISTNTPLIGVNLQCLFKHLWSSLIHQSQSSTPPPTEACVQETMPMVRDSDAGPKTIFFWAPTFKVPLPPHSPHALPEVVLHAEVKACHDMKFVVIHLWVQGSSLGWKAMCMYKKGYTKAPLYAISTMFIFSIHNVYSEGLISWTKDLN
jgi:hypothetical protein